MRLYEECDMGTSAPSLERSLDLVASLVNLFDYTYICLDALDECSEANQKDISNVLLTLCDQCSNLGILVSSRNNQTVIFGQLGDFKFYCITVTPMFVRGDIATYIEHRISSGMLTRGLGLRFTTPLLLDRN